jgi:hypothetical protein
VCLNDACNIRCQPIDVVVILRPVARDSLRLHLPLKPENATGVFELYQGQGED